MKIFRPSSMPLAVACPAALAEIPSEIRLKSVGDPAKIGSAVHAVAHEIVRDNLTALPDLRTHAAEYGIEDSLEELTMLSIFALQAWGKLSDYFAKPICEVEFEQIIKDDKEDIMLRGTIDVRDTLISERAPRRVAILDWKSGYKKRNYIDQMKAYAYAIIADDSTVEEVSSTLVWLRDRDFRTFVFPRKELEKWMETFLKRSAFWDGVTYVEGEHCEFCPRRLGCPKYHEFNQSAVAIFTDEKIKEDGLRLFGEGGALVSPEKIYRAYAQACLVQSVAKKFLEQLKEDIEREGPVILKDRAIGLRQRKGKTIIDPLKAWPVFEEHFSPEEIAQFITVNKGNLTKTKSDIMPRGRKGKAIKAMMEDLKNVGAISNALPVNMLSIIDLDEIKELPKGEEE